MKSKFKNKFEFIFQKNRIMLTFFRRKLMKKIIIFSIFFGMGLLVYLSVQKINKETEGGGSMNLFEKDIDNINGISPMLDRNMAAKLSELPLSCITKKYPNKPGHIHADDSDAIPHYEKTVIFYGCFDWHSSVHMHWTLVRLLRFFPDIPSREQIIELLDSQFTPEKVAKEVEFFTAPQNRTFERIYGWAWLLRLQAEIIISKEEKAKNWKNALDPLVKIIRNRSIDYFNVLPKPVRPGTHANTAFGMDHILKYGIAANDDELVATIKTRALDFYRDDINCPTAYEPSGVDFISPCLAEAHLMSQVMDTELFTNWLDKFLPSVKSREFEPLLAPPHITDYKDYVIGHLVGLNFQRAWSYSGIADVLSEKDPRKKLFENLSATHLIEGLNGMDKTGYGGEHWLASFATYAISCTSDQ